MKIISRHYAGRQPVYDVGLPYIHNYVLANGLVASNCFNRSHSIAYSIIPYIDAYLKAHYPTEFFCALMSIRSQSMQPKLWQQKAPEYIQEAKLLGVNIFPPSINDSQLGFSIKDNNIYFGLNAIRDVGRTAARCIVNARGRKPFKDIFDFLNRVNLQKVNSKTISALVKAGAFDRLGYRRSELSTLVDNLLNYVKDIVTHSERELEIKRRSTEDAERNSQINRRDELREKLKQASRKRNPGPPLSDEEARELASIEELSLKRRKPLELGQTPIKPNLERYKRVPVSLPELIDQASYIGCFIGVHPVRTLFPNASRISSIEGGDYVVAAGVLAAVKIIKDRRGKEMAFLELSDDTGSVEAIVFSNMFGNLPKRPEIGDLVQIEGRTESSEHAIKLIANRINTYLKEQNNV